MKSLLVFVTLAVAVFGAPLNSPTAISQAQQGAAAKGGLVGAAANGDVNAAVEGVKAIVKDNKIANGVLNNAHVDVLKRQTAVSQSEQQGAAKGLAALVGNLGANAAVKGVDADVECNDIANNDLNNANIDILRRDAVAQGVQSGASTGAIAATLNGLINGDVEGVKAKVVNNDIANNVGNDARVKLLTRAQAATQGEQASQASGLLGAVDINGIISAAIDGVTAVVTNNDILNNVGNNAKINVLKRDTTGVAQGAQQGSANGGLAGVDLNAIVNAVVKGVTAKISNNSILNNDLNNLDIGVGQNLPIRRSDGPLAVAQGAQGAKAVGGLAGVAANLLGNVAVKGVDADVEGNYIANNVGNNANVKVL